MSFPTSPDPSQAPNRAAENHPRPFDCPVLINFTTHISFQPLSLLPQQLQLLSSCLTLPVVLQNHYIAVLLKIAKVLEHVHAHLDQSKVSAQSPQGLHPSTALSLLHLLLGQRRHVLTALLDKRSDEIKYFSVKRDCEGVTRSELG